MSSYYLAILAQLVVFVLLPMLVMLVVVLRR